jgi:hypothetical protein
MQGTLQGCLHSNKDENLWSMKAINRGSNHWSSLRLDQRGQFVSQRGFACCVDPINGNAKRMWRDT